MRTTLSITENHYSFLDNIPIPTPNKISIKPTYSCPIISDISKPHRYICSANKNAPTIIDVVPNNRRLYALYSFINLSLTKVETYYNSSTIILSP